MKINKLNTVIEKYIKENLSPKKEEISFVSDRYKELSDMLEGENFQAGSYARFTSMTPINDLDVMWVLPSSYLEKQVRPNDLNPSDILRELAIKLEGEYKNISTEVRIKSQSHSVGIYFGETDEDFSIDIVPAVISGDLNEFNEDIYYVPEISRLSKRKRVERYSDEKRINWIRSDPKGYTSLAKNANDANEGFRKVSKFMRAWKRGCKRNFYDFPLKSFHLELIVMDVFNQRANLTSLDVIKIFFDSLLEYLSNPIFPDRAENSRYVDEYLNSITNEEKEKINIFVRSGEIFIELIENCNDEDEVFNLLSRFLSGEEFIEAHDIKMEINPDYIFKIDGWVRPLKRGSFRGYSLKSKEGKVDWKREIDFKVIKSNLPEEVVLKWKVKNTGKEARIRRSLRGEITEGNTRNIPEKSEYGGSHYVECYAILENVCIAKDRVNVNISK
ncbi:MAG: hypothetical protein WD607_00785 [Candidatus Paceibacterota bacterium]